jgi:hypothetical protein
MQREIRSLEQIEDRQRKRENNRADENPEDAEGFCATEQGKEDQQRMHFDVRADLCLAKIGSAFQINNIQRDRVTCCIYEIQPSCSFGEGHRSGDRASETCGSTELLLVGLFYIAFRGRIRR